MNTYITGNTIKTLREKKGYTQKQLSDILLVSDKTISKWETQKGLPDISLLEPLSKALGVSLTELFSGEHITNKNQSANIIKTNFYVCPICGNIIHSTGEGVFSCCGILLPPLQVEENDDSHIIQIQQIEYDYYITINHDMQKNHYISFFAYLTTNRLQIIKLYPEQNPETRFPILGHGIIYAYCNKHGLFKKRI